MLRLKPPGQEVPVAVELEDGTTVAGELWAWCWVWPGEWKAWIRGGQLEGKAWSAERITPRGGEGLSR